MIEKYLSGNVEFEAVQFTNENKNQVYSWACSIQSSVYPSWDEEKKPILIVVGEKETVVCNFGDYIMVRKNPTNLSKLRVIEKNYFEKIFKKK